VLGEGSLEETVQKLRLFIDKGDVRNGKLQRVAANFITIRDSVLQDIHGDIRLLPQ
ncbi:hypothetical protein KI387_012682, partial [Taxus chinensis]